MMFVAPSRLDRQVAQRHDVGLVARQLGDPVVAPQVDEVDAAALHLAGDLAPDRQLARRHRLAHLGTPGGTSMSPERHPSPSTSTTVGAPSEFADPDVQPVPLGAHRRHRDDDARSVRSSTSTSLGSSAGAPCGRGAARRGDGVVGGRGARRAPARRRSGPPAPPPWRQLHGGGAAGGAGVRRPARARAREGRRRMMRGVRARSAGPCHRSRSRPRIRTGAASQHGACLAHEHPNGCGADAHDAGGVGSRRSRAAGSAPRPRAGGARAGPASGSTWSRSAARSAGLGRRGRRGVGDDVDDAAGGPHGPAGGAVVGVERGAEQVAGGSSRAATRSHRSQTRQNACWARSSASSRLPVST